MVDSHIILNLALSGEYFRFSLAGGARRGGFTQYSCAKPLIATPEQPTPALGFLMKIAHYPLWYSAPA